MTECTNKLLTESGSFASLGGARQSRHGTGLPFGRRQGQRSGVSGHLDVVTIGRIGVDLYPLQDNVGLEDVETFGKYLGGSATNVAVAAARHGRRTAIISRTGPDAFGRYVHKALKEFGVDDRFVSVVPDLLTPIT